VKATLGKKKDKQKGEACQWPVRKRKAMQSPEEHPVLGILCSAEAGSP